MKTTRKRYSAAFKAKVAMEAIRGDLTMAELAAKHGLHHTMIGAWKRQAVEGMADDGDQAAKASNEAEIEKLHAKIGQLLVGGIFWHERRHDEHGSEAKDGPTGQPGPVGCGAMPAAFDQPVGLLLRASARERRDVGADGQTRGMTTPV
jgi:transposase